MLTEQCPVPTERVLHAPPVRIVEASAVLPRHGWYASGKIIADYLCGLTIFLCALPVLAVGALLVKLTSRGPVLYAQVRLGRYGRHYKLFKLRTMIHDCEKLSGPCWSKPGDPRITPIGHFLRKSHVDELPQLFNVLRGEMSLVGPRPERPELAAPLQRALPKYQERLAVKPGLTGLAQIQLPADTDLNSVRRKLALDRFYVRQAGWWLDVRILVGTVLYLARVPYPVIRRLFGFPTVQEVDPLAEAPSEPIRIHSRIEIAA